MSIQDDIFNYVMKTPANTNASVLKSMINKTVQLVPFNLKIIGAINPNIEQGQDDKGKFAQFYEDHIVICDNLTNAKYIIPEYSVISSASGDIVTYSFSFFIDAPKDGTYIVTVNGENVIEDHGFHYLYAESVYPAHFNVVIKHQK